MKTKSVCKICGAERFEGRNDALCLKHYRLHQMSRSSSYMGKEAPTIEYLESILDPDMKCEICREDMVWLSSQDRRKVATIQHYRDGSIGIICRSCNTRHAWTPGDTYADIGPSNKWCSSCKTPKDLDQFYRLDGSKKLRNRNMVSSYCKKCSIEKAKISNKKARERIYSGKQSIPE